MSVAMTLVVKAVNNAAKSGNNVGHCCLMANLQCCQYLPTVVRNEEKWNQDAPCASHHGGYP
jgi:hypothetical protein